MVYHTVINPKKKKRKAGNRGTGRAMRCGGIRVQFEHRLEGGGAARHEGVWGKALQTAEAAWAKSRRRIATAC